MIRRRWEQVPLNATLDPDATIRLTVLGPAGDGWDGTRSATQFLWDNEHSVTVEVLREGGGPDAPVSRATHLSPREEGARLGAIQAVAELWRAVVILDAEVVGEERLAEVRRTIKAARVVLDLLEACVRADGRAP